MTHMGPMNWLILFSLFMLSYMTFMFMSYFTYMVSLISFSPLLGVNFMTVGLNYNTSDRYFLMKSNDNIYYDSSFLLVSNNFCLKIVPLFNYNYLMVSTKLSLSV